MIPRTNHYFRCFELYKNTNPAKWGVTETFVRKVTHGRTRFQFCGYVLAYFFYLVFIDIIQNHVTFEFPLTGSERAYLYVKCTSDEKFMEEYANGRFKGIDFIASEYKGYQIFYQWHFKNNFKEKPVYMCDKMKKWFYSKINNGEQYY